MLIRITIPDGIRKNMVVPEPMIHMSTHTKGTGMMTRTDSERTVQRSQEVLCHRNIGFQLLVALQAGTCSFK